MTAGHNAPPPNGWPVMHGYTTADMPRREHKLGMDPLAQVVRARELLLPVMREGETWLDALERVVSWQEFLTGEVEIECVPGDCDCPYCRKKRDDGISSVTP